MQKKQLQILRDHGELWTDQDVQKYFSHNHKENKAGLHKLFKGNDLQMSVFSSIPINEEYYCVDQKVFKILEQMFESYLLYEGNSNPLYQDWIKNKLTLYSPLNEDKKRLLCNEIIGINEELDFLLMEAFGTQIPMPTDEKQLKSKWYLFLSKEDVVSLVELLKFDIFDGERIESFDSPFFSEASEKSCLLNIYFSQHDEIQMLCKIVSLIENINYLNKLIEELENPTEKTIVKETLSDNNNFANNDLQENIFCKGMPIPFATDHFNFFTKENSKNGKPFLTNDQLKNFITRAFLGKEGIEKINFNWVIGDRKTIIRQFYNFYHNPDQITSSKYDLRPKRRDFYIKLLTDNFMDFDFEIIKENFSKK